MGADGIWSKVRRKMLGDSQPNYSEYTCYTGISDFTPADIDTGAAGARRRWHRDAATLLGAAGMLPFQTPTPNPGPAPIRPTPSPIHLLCLPPPAAVGYRVFLGNGKYFVSSDVGGGKMQWYGFHKEPANGTGEQQCRAVAACAPGESCCRPARALRAAAGGDSWRSAGGCPCGADPACQHRAAALQTRPAPASSG